MKFFENYYDFLSTHHNNGDIVGINGVITRIDNIEQHAIEVTFECKECGKKLTELQESEKLKKPFCDCGNKTSFEIKNVVTEVTQRIILEWGNSLYRSIHVDVIIPEKFISKKDIVKEENLVHIEGKINIEFARNTRKINPTIIAEKLELVILDDDVIDYDTDEGKTINNKMRIICKLVKEMQGEREDKSVLIEDVKVCAEEQGIEDAEEIIKKLKREGELFEPRHAYIRRV